MSDSNHTIHHEASLESTDEVQYRSNFFDETITPSRRVYIKKLVGGTVSIVILLFAVMSIYWGALWKSPHNLQGLVVDFDGGIIGQAVVRGLNASKSKVTWTAVPASSFPRGPHEVADAVVGHKTWVAVAIHQGASDRLLASYGTPNASYNGSEAITVYVGEARNENAYRALIRPSVQTSMEIISQSFAIQSVQYLVTSPNLTNLLHVSPQTAFVPVSYVLDNLVPFDEPVASATIFVGLIYVLILAFFVVNMGFSARQVTGFDNILNLRSLILTRLFSSFALYFIISLFYSLLSLAFQLNFTRKYGGGGFVIFWMLNFVAMLAVGLALESAITILTPRFLPFFIFLWIIVNVSVCILPIEVQPVIFRYGYGVPFYNVSLGVRSIVFGTKNELGLNFGVLLIWTVISCATLPLFQIYTRKNQIKAMNQNRKAEEKEMSKEERMDSREA